MDSVIYDICNGQRRIYQLAYKKNYSMKQFSDLYLKSGFCSREFDAEWSRFHLETAEESMDFILPEIGEALNEVTAQDTDIDLAGYVGFMYRYLFFVTPYSSAELADRVSFEDIAKTVDEAMIKGEDLVVEEICNKHGLEYDSDKI